MKKVYVLGLFLIMFGANAFAQDETSKTFRGGLKISPSFMWLKTEPELTGTKIENVGSYVGFSYGVFGDYYFADNYGISTELRIAHLGAEYNYTPLNDNSGSSPEKVAMINRTLNLQYVEIPVTLKMRTNEIGYMRYFGQFGFMPSINIKAKADDVYTMRDIPSTKIEENDKKVGKEVNPLGLSLVIGAGVEYNLGGSTSLLGGISFNNGFTNLINKKEDDQTIRSFRNFNAKPAYIALNLGVIF